MFSTPQSLFICSKNYYRKRFNTLSHRDSFTTAPPVCTAGPVFILLDILSVVKARRFSVLHTILPN